MKGPCQHWYTGQFRMSDEVMEHPARLHGPNAQRERAKAIALLLD